MSILYEINHVHLKSPDPRKTAEWYAKVFNFRINKDEVRALGDRFVRCSAPGGMVVNISEARTNERLNPGDANAHWGLEHFGLTVKDIHAECKRLEGLGAKVLEWPFDNTTGKIIAFIQAPDNTRIELIEDKSAT